jgi:hypothetical protein
LGGLSRGRTCALVALAVLFVATIDCTAGRAEDNPTKFAYEGEVEYCRKTEARPFALNDDKRILCFDGWITSDTDLSVAEGLAPDGLFVVRSFGGSVAKAIALAGLLHDKHARVVVYDYCNSACAKFLFIASDQTFVRRNSLVVFHNVRSGLRDCFQFEAAHDNGRPTLQSSPCPGVPIEAQALYRSVVALQTGFLKDRTTGPGFDPPESTYVRRVLKSMLDETGVYPTNVGWMWNPRNYPPTLKTKVTYEAYPESQEEVDAIAARFRRSKVIFDP